MMRNRILIVFLLVTLGGGMAVALACPPGPWYANLPKPGFTPPNWLFPPAWTALYVMVAIAGARTWQRNRRGASMRTWFVQLALNFVWSPVFFVMHDPLAAFIVIVALLTTILAFVGMSWHRDRLSALLFLPYAAWVAFAAALNGAILRLAGVG